MSFWSWVRKLVVGAQAALFIGGVLGLALYATGAICSIAASGPDTRVFEPGLLGVAGYYGFALLLAGLGLAIVTAPGWWRLLPLAGIVVGVPGLFAVMLELGDRAWLPGEVNRVELPSGRAFMLGGAPILTDVAFDLWEAEGPGRHWWRRIDAVTLSYSEAGEWTSDPALVATPDGKRLLVRRGGIWADCIQVEPEIGPCPDVAPTVQASSGMSDVIERVTGLSPGPPELRKKYRESRSGRRRDDP